MDDPTEVPGGSSDDSGLDPTRRESVERIDTTIGPYRLLERLGEGAMGEVWRAEQREPIKRIVALKIIKRGMDTREVVTRFEIERQAMALMDHPWIARVYDAGETGGGRPYIAMEYVAGERITDYCARHRLSIEERLRLFQRVCQAIQHAHQKAVIHRDLKPSNILVVEIDGEAVPKVIDFGIAKATAQRLTDRSAATFVGQLIGTPLYMSPEQVEMSAAGVDTRADVYSLGVILYEMLTGALPHDPDQLARSAFDEVLKVLREVDPPRPSTRISTLGDRTAEIAAQRGLDAKRLVGKLRGDLDWITLKALEKDRRRRYETPRDVADDIERYLRLEAVEARPPSASYRVSRFVRRHRARVTVATAAFLALAGFAVWQTVQSDRLARARDRAMANERLSLAREELAEDPTVAIAYALSSLELVDQPGARDLVRKAIAEGPMREQWPRHGAPGNPISVDASADGRLCAVAWSQSRNPTVGVYDVATLDMRLLTAPTEGVAYNVTLNADATHVGAIGDDGVHVWRVADGTHRWHFTSTSIENASWQRTNDPRKLWLSTWAVDEPVVLLEIDLDEGTIIELGRTRGRHRENVDNHDMWIDPAGAWVLDYDGDRIFLQRTDALEDAAAVEVGRHDAPLASVSLDQQARTAISVDVRGHVRIWDLASRPARLIGEYDQEPGIYITEPDPFAQRFFTSWGSDRLRLFDPMAAPRRRPVELRDRSHWTHDGAFLPDGSVVASANGRTPARWRLETPRAWTFALPDSIGSAIYAFDREGRWLYVWGHAGQVLAFSLVEGEGDQVRSLARTPAWNAGTTYGFSVSDDGRRVVTYSAPEPGPRVIDLGTGTVRFLPESTRQIVLYGVSPSGRSGCLMTRADDGETVVVRVVDFDSMETRAEFLTGSTVYRSVAFDGDDALVGLASDHVVRFDLTRIEAPPDTLWRGDARRGGLVLRDARSVVVRDASMRLRWIDFDERREIVLGSAPGGALTAAATDPSGRLLAVGGWWDTIQVFDVDTAREWKIPIATGTGRGSTFQLAFDPLGRWLVSRHDVGLVGWRLPLDDLFSEIPHGELLERVRALTNVRVVADPTEALGFRVTNVQDLVRVQAGTASRN